MQHAAETIGTFDMDTLMPIVRIISNALRMGPDHRKTDEALIETSQFNVVNSTVHFNIQLPMFQLWLQPAMLQPRELPQTSNFFVEGCARPM